MDNKGVSVGVNDLMNELMKRYCLIVKELEDKAGLGKKIGEKKVRNR